MQKTCDRTEYGDIVLTFVKRAWICEYGAPTLQHYDWEYNKLIFKEERWGKIWSAYVGQCLFQADKETVVQCSDIEV